MNPDDLTDDEWIARYNEYQYIETRKFQQLKTVFKSSIIEVLNQVNE